MRIGVFGGTFDPPHIGHLIVAQEVHLRLGLDRLLLVPAADPPHKSDRVITPGAVRLDMLRAVLRGDPRLEVSELEVVRPGPSYTVDTLRTLSGQHPSAKLYLVLGADQLAEFHTWKEPAAIRSLATLVAFDRAGAWPDLNDLEVVRVEVPRIDLSATAIRARVAAGEPVRYMVPEAVAAMIGDRGLYRGGERR